MEGRVTEGMHGRMKRQRKAQAGLSWKCKVDDDEKKKG
jgi:hypothetical protein